jgi:peptidoglycan biosynthesis protein MviN/MurJ (putative lipid II flippase)
MLVFIIFLFVLEESDSSYVLGWGTLTQAFLGITIGVYASLSAGVIINCRWMFEDSHVVMQVRQWLDDWFSIESIIFKHIFILTSLTSSIKNNNIVIFKSSLDSATVCEMDLAFLWLDLGCWFEAVFMMLDSRLLTASFR